MMTAPSTAWGKWWKSGIRNSTDTAISAAVISEARPVFAPAEKLTTERLNPPVTGYAPVTPAAKLAAPSAMSSWLDSTFCRRFDCEGLRHGNAFEEADKADRERERDQWQKLGTAERGERELR